MGCVARNLRGMLEVCNLTFLFSLGGIDQVVEVFAPPQFATVWHQPLCFQLFERFWISCVFINRDDARCACMRRSKRFREEAPGCMSISCGAEEKFQRVSLRIHSTREVHPHLFHFDVRLIDAPRVIRGFEMRSAALLQFRCIALHESGRLLCAQHAIPARTSSPPDLDS